MCLSWPGQRHPGNVPIYFPFLQTAATHARDFGYTRALVVTDNGAGRVVQDLEAALASRDIHVQVFRGEEILLLPTYVAVK